MKDKVALWKQRICDRKAKGQTIIDWCEEHNITKGSYHYWRKQVNMPKVRVINRSLSPNRLPLQT